MIRRVVFALFVGGVVASSASAQAPSGPVYATPQAPPIPATSDVPPPPPTPAVVDRSSGPAKTDQAKRAISRSNPTARRASSVPLSDSNARRDLLATDGRFANPGGVGRYAEYYTSRTPTSQLELHGMPQTRFDRGGGPDRAEQIAAFRAGQQRTANIQNNLNAYGRPYIAYGAGFGYGYGLGLGGLYGGGLR
jgi:hypothetical protein